MATTRIIGVAVKVAPNANTYEVAKLLNDLLVAHLVSCVEREREQAMFVKGEDRLITRDDIEDAE